MRLEGKVALITGAASGVEDNLMGFGGTSARLFVREGAKVVLTDIQEEVGEKTAAQIREDGGDAVFVRLDVTDERDWMNAIQYTVSNFGKLDVLVNNAGTSARQSVEDTTSEVWDGEMDVHAKGTFLGTKHAIPEMRKVGGGSIINISSIYGIIGSPRVPFSALSTRSPRCEKSAAAQSSISLQSTGSSAALHRPPTMQRRGRYAYLPSRRPFSTPMKTSGSTPYIRGMR